MTESIAIRRGHWQMMRDHVRHHAPEEACGLLGGPPGRAEALYVVENIRHSPVAYEMDPRAQVEAMAALEAHGWDVTAIFHSHPAGPPSPSRTDVAQAYYPDAAYLIWSPTGPDDWQVRAFRIERGAVREIAVVLLE